MLLAQELGEDSFTPQLIDYVQENADAILFTADGPGDGDMWFAATAAEQHNGALFGTGGKVKAAGLLGVNAASKNMEAVTAFMQTLFSAEVQGSSAYNDGYPVNTAALDAILAKEEASMSLSVGFGSVENSFSTQWPSKAARNTVKQIILAADAPLINDAIADTMVMPELESYLRGDVTLEAATQSIASKLSVYLAE